MTTTPRSTTPVPGSVTSADGTRIGYELSGEGPVVVLVSSALADRTDHRKLAALLATDYTVINYDRRGRGESGDTQPWTPQREVEDIEALIDAHGGRAALFGASAGAVVALDAAAALGDKITSVIAFEAPLIVDDSRPAIGPELAEELQGLIDRGEPGAAVTRFSKVALQASPPMMLGLWLMVPQWRAIVAMAPTTVYELRLLRGLIEGGPIPQDRWSAIGVPTLLLSGGKSGPAMHSATAAVAEQVDGAQRRVLDGCITVRRSWRLRGCCRSSPTGAGPGRPAPELRRTSPAGDGSVGRVSAFSR